MSRLPELTEKVDAMFTRVVSRHGADMQCGSGCSDCCHVRLSITAVEASAIRELLVTWAPAARAELAASALRPSENCAALDAGGRCRIYAARPLVCRSHGAPIRMREGSLPVVQWCHRNFTATSPDPDCVIDQETLSALTLAVDRAAGNDGRRFDLATVLGSE